MQVTTVIRELTTDATSMVTHPHFTVSSSTIRLTFKHRYLLDLSTKVTLLQLGCSYGGCCRFCQSFPSTRKHPLFRL